jgi:hypothetical protein
MNWKRKKRSMDMAKRKEEKMKDMRRKVKRTKKSHMKVRNEGKGRGREIGQIINKCHYRKAGPSPSARQFSSIITRGEYSPCHPTSSIGANAIPGATPNAIPAGATTNAILGATTNATCPTAKPPCGIPATGC